MYYHFAARALRYTTLVDDAVEAAALWERLSSRLAGATALIVMPNHVHAILSTPDPELLVRGCRAYARWRNAARGESGAVWQPLDPPKLSTPDKLRRDGRYVHLNASRARLVACPLAYALSAYRDAVGLAPEPLRKAVEDAAGMHRYVSSDPTVAVTGTPLPTALDRPPTLREVAAAVAGLYRAPLSAIRERGPVRRLFVAAARTLTSAGIAEIAEMAGVLANAVQRVGPRRDALVERVARVAGDARFAPVPEGSFWALPEWARYADARGICVRDR